MMTKKTLSTVLFFFTSILLSTLALASDQEDIFFDKGVIVRYDLLTKNGTIYADEITCDRQKSTGFLKLDFSSGTLKKCETVTGNSKKSACHFSAQYLERTIATQKNIIGENKERFTYDNLPFMLSSENPTTQYLKLLATAENSKNLLSFETFKTFAQEIPNPLMRVIFFHRAKFTFDGALIKSLSWLIDQENSEAALLRLLETKPQHIDTVIVRRIYEKIPTDDGRAEALKLISPSFLSQLHLVDTFFDKSLTKFDYFFKRIVSEEAKLKAILYLSNFEGIIPRETLISCAKQLSYIHRIKFIESLRLDFELLMAIITPSKEESLVNDDDRIRLINNFLFNTPPNLIEKQIAEINEKIETDKYRLEFLKDGHLTVPSRYRYFYESMKEEAFKLKFLQTFSQKLSLSTEDALYLLESFNDISKKIAAIETLKTSLQNINQDQAHKLLKSFSIAEQATALTHLPKYLSLEVAPEDQQPIDTNEKNQLTEEQYNEFRSLPLDHDRMQLLSSWNDTHFRVEQVLNLLSFFAYDDARLDALPIMLRNSRRLDLAQSKQILDTFRCDDARIQAQAMLEDFIP